jgi:alpha-beta hydrolase superfamily lysophospholipase
MLIEESQLTARDGATLFCRRARPTREPKGLVVLVHGLGEHSGRYGHVVERLVTAGLETVFYDHRGHGLSSGRRGDAPSFDLFLEDLAHVIAFAGREPFLYGHSFGGLVTLRFLQQQRERVRGAVVASPLLRLVFQPPRWKLALAAIARRIWPTLTQNSGVDPSVLSRDMGFLASTKQQDLSHRKISARLFYEFMLNAERAMAEGNRVCTPVLLIHGQSDQLTCCEATQELFPTLASEDKALRIYPDTFHETHNDVNREEVIHEVVSWFLQRV